MIGRNFLEKNTKTFSEHKAKILSENFLPLSRNRKNKMLSNFVFSQKFKPISV